MRAPSRSPAAPAEALGHAYHRPECREIQDAKGVKMLDESDALDKGLSHCRTCKP